MAVACLVSMGTARFLNVESNNLQVRQQRRLGVHHVCSHCDTSAFNGRRTSKEEKVRPRFSVISALAV